VYLRSFTHLGDRLEALMERLWPAAAFSMAVVCGSWPRWHDSPTKHKRNRGTGQVSEGARAKVVQTLEL
jgi:hypothetical protein